MSESLTAEALPPVVDAAAWQAALDEQIAAEKAHTRAGDALAAQRRRLPMVEVRGDYAFTDVSDGASVSLLDAFGDAQQLLVYHFMPVHDDGGTCPGCTYFTNQVAHIDGLDERDTTFVVISNSDVDALRAARERNGWEHLRFLSSQGTTFSEDMGRVHGDFEGFGLSVFLRSGNDVYRTYVTQGRGVENAGSVTSFLDLTPMGRQQEWEDTPAGRPQRPTYG